MRRRSTSSPPGAMVTRTAELPCSATPTTAARCVSALAILPRALVPVAEWLPVSLGGRQSCHGPQVERLDARHGADFVVVADVAGDADRSQHLAPGAEDDHATRRWHHASLSRRRNRRDKRRKPRASLG